MTSLDHPVAVLIPLYVTVQHLEGEVVLVVAEPMLFWLVKYEWLLRQLSRYPLVVLGAERYTHCFRQLRVGLKIHEDLNASLSSW